MTWLPSSYAGAPNGRTFGGEVVLPAHPPQARAPGRLPVAGPLRLGGVDLGSGRPIVPERDHGVPRPPVVWMTDAQVPAAVAAWSSLAGRFPSTGLWPLLLDSLYDGSGRPWSSGELSPASEVDIDALDPLDVLERGWHGSLVPIRNPWAPGTGPLALFGPEFPGLTQNQPSSDDGPVVSDPGGTSHLGLVSCRRPADAVAVAGWMGAINLREPVEVSAVLRSWEDRFGAVLVGLGFATVTLLINRPPTSDREALRVAAEVAAFCPDALWQPESQWPYSERDRTLEALSREVVRKPVWRLWFD